MEFENTNCPVCGAFALSEVNDHVYEFQHGRKKHRITDLSHSVCSECGTSMFLPEQLNSNNLKVRAFQETLSDFISPAQVLKLREIYSITQKQANIIFGGGPTAFSKYERGVASPTAGTARHMLAALKDAKFMISLAAVQNVKIKKVHALAESKERFIDSLPTTLRRRIERYAGAVTLSLQESCITLLEKSIDAFESSEHSGAKRHAVIFKGHSNYMVVDHYPVQDFEVSEQTAKGEHSTKIKFGHVVTKMQREYSKC